jgi:hypothetical protein
MPAERRQAQAGHHSADRRAQIGEPKPAAMRHSNQPRLIRENERRD